MDNTIFGKDISRFVNIFGEKVTKFEERIKAGENIIIKKYFNDKLRKHSKSFPLLSILITNKSTILVLVIVNGSYREEYVAELFINEMKMTETMKTMVMDVLNSGLTYTQDSLIYVSRIINKFIVSFSHIKDIENIQQSKKELEDLSVRVDEKKFEFERERAEFNKRKRCQEELDAERAQLDDYSAKLDERAKKLLIWAQTLACEQKIIDDEKQPKELRLGDLEEKGAKPGNSPKLG